MGNPIRISKDAFSEIRTELQEVLSSLLQEEVDLQSFDNQENSGIWETPVVDSKSVIKLSPEVESRVGCKIEPEWIQAGGYDSVEEAIEDLLTKIEDHINKIGGGQN